VEGTTRWARNGDVNIAYRALGEGPMDLVFISGFISHIDVLLEEPGLRRWFERLGAFARVILVDRRGSGLSDPLTGTLTLEDETGDLLAVLDALDSDRAVLMSYAAGGPLAVAFAALHPERTLALILYASIVRNLRDEGDWDWASSQEERRERIERLVADWGTGVNLEVMAPSAVDDARMRAWLGRLERLSMTPSGLQRVFENVAHIDVRPMLERIRVPTLLLHRTGDQLIDIRHSRHMAAHIAGARFVELPGEDSLPMVGDVESILGEVENFLTGGRRGVGMQRELLTVVFTDIVDATVRAARQGDTRWRDLLAAHDQAVRDEIARFGGEEVKTIGVAVLIPFAGPPSQAIRCARAIVAATRELGLDVRVGLHTGECERVGEDVGGMAVHIAARVAALAEPCEVLMSGTVFGTVVGCGLEFEERGSQALKGVPGMWPIFALAQ
jgi:class 3 adenylate cyclase